MGKKNKKEENEKFPLAAEVANFEAKYPVIIPCIDANLVRQIYEVSIPSNMRENGVSWNITASFTVEKKFFLELKRLVLEGDIDLEIAIIEQFMPIGRMLIKKLGYKGDDLDNKVETAITDTIENYQGQDAFKSEILKSLKVIVKGKKEEPVNPPLEVVNPLESESFLEPINSPDEVLPSEDFSASVELEEKGETSDKMVLPNDGKLRLPTTLDSLIASVDIISKSPLEDGRYIQFLSLKYGYYEGQFFSLEEIRGILSLTVAETRDYYLQSLQFIKDWFGYQLERYYTYQKQIKAND